MKVRYFITGILYIVKKKKLFGDLDFSVHVKRKSCRNETNILDIELKFYIK